MIPINSILLVTVSSNATISLLQRSVASLGMRRTPPLSFANGLEIGEATSPTGTPPYSKFPRACDMAAATYFPTRLVVARKTDTGLRLPH